MTCMVLQCWLTAVSMICFVVSDVLHVLMKFFLTLFNALQSQIGAALVERTTQTFMTLLTKYV